MSKAVMSKGRRTAKRVTRTDRRAADHLVKKPRTRPVPHPFELPNITAR
jgi:hypothetical protein